METKAVWWASGLFIVLTITLVVCVLLGVRQAYRRLPEPRLTAQATRCTLAVGLALLLWLTLGAALAVTGLLTDFEARPPRLVLLVLPPLLLAFWLVRSEAVGRLLDGIPPAGLIMLQSCRIAVEVVLWLLFIGGEIPVQMTFEGLNWDILTGLTAPLVAYYCFRKRSWPWQVAFGWNIAGLLLVANIVTIAFLSAPLPIRYFSNEPANTIVTHFPMVWLPSFVVPLAYIAHLLSLRQLWRRAVRAKVPAQLERARA